MSEILKTTDPIIHSDGEGDSKLTYEVIIMQIGRAQSKLQSRKT